MSERTFTADGDNVFVKTDRGELEFAVGDDEITVHAEVEYYDSYYGHEDTAWTTFDLSPAEVVELYVLLGSWIESREARQLDNAEAID